jgi:hypothetical protein
MSVLDELGAMPNRVRALAEVVASEKNLSREDIARRFVPGVGTESKEFRQLLSECTGLGVVEEDADNKRYRLGSGISSKQVSDNDQFLDFCRTRLVPHEDQPSNKNNLFSRVLAWFLTRPIGPNLESGGDFKIEIAKDLEGEDIYRLTNVERSSMFMYWAQALGFAEWLNFGNGVFCNPDPTRAMAVAFASVLEKKNQTPIDDVFEKLSDKLPVFETGWVRNEVEARLRKSRDPNYISQSSSLALSRLRLGGVITLSHLADAPKTMLMVDLDRKEEPVSHVGLGEALRGSP